MPWPTEGYTSQGLVRATIQGKLHGQVINNVLWFSLAGELGTIDWPAKLTELAQAIINCVVTTLLPGLSSQYALESVTAALLSTADKIQIVVPAPANSVGGLGESLPAQAAATVTLYTPYGGHSRRGGMRIAGIPEANHALSVLSGPPIEAIAAFLACMLTNFKFDGTASKFDWIIYSRKLGFVKPSTCNLTLDTMAPVTNTVVRTTCGSQNSRKLGRGA